MKHNYNPVPQLRVHTNLIAGESVEACQRNLDQWTRQLQQKCYGRARARNQAPGYAPYLETEMQPWQAADV
jgi:hypothetical protein